MTETIILATTNQGKIREYRELLRELPYNLVGLSEIFADNVSVEETGATFEENAILKARHSFDRYRQITLAEDAGLEVDLLQGRPGVRSARFAGDHASDSENRKALMLELKEVSHSKITARFKCVIAMIHPNSESTPLLFAGTCEGQVILTEKGLGGFGYDSIFIPDGYTCTMAELSIQEKNSISHRFVAVQKWIQSIPITQ